MTESAIRRFSRWVRHAPAERLPLPAAPAVWTAAEILHLAHLPGLYPGAATVTGAALAYAIGEKRASSSEHARLAGAETAAVTGAAGAWVTAATVLGPLAGPWHLLSAGYLAAAGGGYWWLRRHEAVRAARERRDAAARWRQRKADWQRLAPALRLGGSHLLDHSETLLGESMLADIRGTGKLVSQISTREVAERYGEIEMIPAGRIDVAPDRIPGRLRISIRRKDPWAQPLTHPAADPSSPYAAHAPEVTTCHKPVVIGADPETGAPLLLPVWDADEGAKVILIAAKKGSGKTVLMSDIRERVTAAADAIFIQVNVSMPRHDRRWAPLAAANALGRHETGRARLVLQFIVNAISARSDAGGDDRMTTPSPDQPLIVVFVDEIDRVAADPVCKELLNVIASKCRNEAVTLIAAGQRATAQWLGGGDLRANVDIAVLGRFARSGEARKATGEETGLPDMGKYGEGHPGVWLITELGGGGSYHRGRVFNLDQPADIDAIVARRARRRRPYQLEPALSALSADWEKITAGAPGDGGTGSDTGGSSPGPAGPAGPVRPAAPAGPAAGQLLPGTGQITAKIGQARAAADSTPDIPEIPPGMQQHAADLLAERRRQFFDAYTDISLPEREQAVLRQLLAAPGGTSTRQAALAIGRSHMHVSRQFHRWRHDGTAEVRGHGSARRWHLTPGTPPASTGDRDTDGGGTGYPPLRAVPGPADSTPGSNAQ